MTVTLEHSKGQSQVLSKVLAITLAARMDEGTLHRKMRLRGLIDSRFGGSQKDFGIAVGMSEGRVSQIADPDKHSFGERSARNIAGELRLDERYFELGYSESEFVPVRRVDVAFSNGTGTVVYAEDDKPPLSFRSDFLRKLGISQGDAVIVDAVGFSNQPRILEGAVVLVNQGDKGPLNGDFFAFRDEDQLLIKRLSTIPGVGILAVAENPDFKPKTKVYTDLENFQVIGRCKWTGIEL
jgi:phage repressor protein C with HTH and peptisase S24 domain